MWVVVSQLNVADKHVGIYLSLCNLGTLFNVVVTKRKASIQSHGLLGVFETFSLTIWHRTYSRVSPTLACALLP